MVTRQANNTAEIIDEDQDNHYIHTDKHRVDRHGEQKKLQAMRQQTGTNKNTYGL